MIAILRLDAEGVVVAANGAAEELLGACVGRRCCDVVLARASDRHLVCRTDCAKLLAKDNSRGREARGVRVRGRTVRLICAAADDNPTVLVIEDDVGHANAVLSPRECSVLALVAAGHGDDDIARALGVASSTVKTHLGRARTKLGARTRAQAVALAMRSGLIP